MNIKHLLKRLPHYIKQMMPYEYVLKYEDKYNFHRDFEKWEKSGSKVTFDSESKFDNIIAVCGFGYSGSGAVIDLLREYDECLVHGMAEGGSQAVVADDDLGEVTFVTAPGGLIDIDKYMDVETSALQCEVLNRFAKMIYRNAVYHLGSEYREYIYQFFKQLFVDRQYMPGTLSPVMPAANSILYSMSPLSKKDYYTLCSDFLYSLFNLLWEKHHAKYLVLDQFCQTSMLDISYNRRFIPNLKTIIVYRDPRDIYYIAKTQDIPWLEHDTVEHFIRRVQRQYSKLDIKSKSYLPIKFEDLILDYDNTVSKIEKYLGLGNHVRPQSCLNTSISCKNIGRWKNCNIPVEEFDLIAKTFPDMCYNG